MQKNFLIQSSQNSIRILLTYIEKFYLLNKVITLEECKKNLTNINYNLLASYTRNIFIEKKISNSLVEIQSILKKGYSVIDILNEYYYFVKNTNILNETLKYNVITIICKYISYFYGKQEHNIELFLFTNELYNINC